MTPSYHHAYLSSNMIVALHKLKKYSVFSELALQLEKDYVADVCIYPKRKIQFSAGDVIKMTEAPLMVVEILSPTQGTQEILEKFVGYFQAGIRSCWLVIPVAQSVTVYSSMEQARTFTQGEVVDTVLDIRIPVEEIFFS
ncbi:putative restriction endonuclease [Candidatus Electrothrix marina]|uniref:Putative restriction endonuclease n=1 Tax=Candidatus Electrothrix marina TaxID=1859130 RepID=A0A444JED6_9BACT|nr:putative restriction endonuclease [Candidatus Electrothrix marina]